MHNKLIRFCLLLLFCVLTANTINAPSQAMTDDDPNKANGVICFKDGKPFPRREISVNDILKPNNPYTCGFKSNGRITYPPSKTYFQGQDHAAGWWIQTNDEDTELTGRTNFNQLYGNVYRSDMIDEETGEILTKNIKGKLHWHPYEADGKSYESTFLQASPTEKVKSGLFHLIRPSNDNATASIVVKFNWFQVITGRGNAYADGTNYIAFVAFPNGNPTIDTRPFSPLTFHNMGIDKLILKYPNYTMTSDYGEGNQGHTPYFKTHVDKMPDSLKNKPVDITIVKNNYLIVIENAEGEFPLLWKGLVKSQIAMLSTNIPVHIYYEIYDLNTSQRVKKGYKTTHWNPWDFGGYKETPLSLFDEAINSTDPNEDIFKGISK
jgi:hypothetical protein